MHEQVGSRVAKGTSEPVGTGTEVKEPARFENDLVGDLLDAVHDAATLSDADDLIVYANLAAKKLFGNNIATAKLTVASLFDPAWTLEVAERAAVEVATRGSRPWEGRLCRIGRDGRPFTTQAQVRSVLVRYNPGMRLANLALLRRARGTGRRPSASGNRRWRGRA